MSEQENKNQMSVEEALLMAEASHTRAMQAAKPPRWFGVAIAFLTGGMVATSAANNTTYTALLIAGIAMVIAIQQEKTGALPRYFPRGSKSILGLLGIIIFALLLVAAGRYLHVVMEFVFAPVIAGGVMALFIFWLAGKERGYHQQNSGQADD